MALSSDLISQLVKITNDEPEQPKESTVYGTTVAYEGKIFVRIDGSDKLTPVDNTSNMGPDERVMVMIKNHTATVTGNLSSPSARMLTDQNGNKSVEGLSEQSTIITAAVARIDTIEADYVNTEELNAQKARIDTIEADYVNTDELNAVNARIDKIVAGDITADLVTTEQLNAVSARIDNLGSTYATITRLESSEGKIETLESNVANITTLVSDKATIGQLNAVDARVGTLEGATANIGDLTAKVGKIDTLIYGSASGSSIQSSFANSIVALIGDAKIKSAMIESINAEKITAGDIITDNVKVKSSAGKLLISGETMQISDSSRVRVQIGKDASDDYSINIWDESGNLMFSKGGITDKAIKDAIIVDDMVSDSADISASKLDIDSLFSVINNDTSHTLKATKVKLDETGQTLELAFDTLNTTVTGQGESISAHGRRLTSIEDTLSSEIWTQSIDELDGKLTTLSTDHSTLKQTVNGLSSTVSSHTTQIANKAEGSAVTSVSDKVAALEQNLDGFKTTVSETYANRHALYRHNLLDDSTDEWTLITPAPAATILERTHCSHYGLSAGDQITISAELRPETKTNLHIRVMFYSNETGATGLTMYDGNLINKGETGLSSVTATIPSGSPYICILIKSSVTSETSVSDEYYRKLKLEQGAFATEWVPPINSMLDIGGANCLPNSCIGNAVTESLKSGGEYNINSTSGTYRVIFDNLSLEPDIYTFSCYIKQLNANGESTNIKSRFAIRTTNSQTYHDASTESDDWELYTLRIDVKSSEEVYSLYLYNYDTSGVVVENIGIKKVKIERGTVATDWVPAQADIDARFEAAESSITQLSNKITANVTETTNLGTRTSTLEQTATELTASLTAAETDIKNAAKTATDYMNLSSGGLVVGQNPSNPTAGNTLISTDGVTIRKGTTVLSEFKAGSRTTSGISSATLTSTDSTDSESDGTTSVSGTVSSNETRANVYISTNGNPLYFPNGIETDKVLINNSSGIIANCNMLLNGSLVDKSGEGILTPLNSYGNTIIGYGRYQDGGATHVYGTYVKAKTKNGFSASVNGVPALDTNNDSGNATFGWHLYENSSGETNIYGNITSLFSKDDIRLNAAGNNIRMNGSLIPYTANEFNIGSSSLSLRNMYISIVNDGSYHGIRYANSSGTTYNAVGTNETGYPVFGNTTYCTNLICKSTTTSNTGYSFKITCGDNPELTLGNADARLFLFGGTDSTSRYIGSCAAYKRTYTSTSNMVITDNSIIGRVTSSSRRYKKDIVDLSIDTVKALYNLPVRQFKYEDGYIANDDQRYNKDIPGFIAEEVFEHLPVACDLIQDSSGEVMPEMWNSNIIIPALLKLIQDLNTRLIAVEKKGY